MAPRGRRRARFSLAAVGLLAATCGWTGCASHYLPALTTQPAAGPRTGYDVADEPPERRLTDASGLADYLAVAALNNPAMEAAFHRWRAAEAESAQVTAPPDPRLTYRYFIEEVETRVGAQRQAIEVSQTLPPWGTLRLRGDAAGHAAEAARLDYEAAKLKVFYDVTDAWYEYYYLYRSIDLTEQNLDLVRTVERIATARYRAVAARHADVIRAQIKLAELDDRLSRLRQLRAPLAARLNAAMNRPADAEVPWPRQAPLPSVNVTAAESRRWLAETNPQLQASDSEIARRRTQVDLARKAYWPDLTVGVQWIDTAEASGAMRPPDSGKDPWIAMVSVNVPLWRSRLDAAVRQARRRQAAAEADRARLAGELESRLAMALYGIADAQRRVELYRDTLIPRADESLAVLTSGYRAGETGFVDLMDAIAVVLEFHLAFERVRADLGQRVSELEMLVGRPVPRTGVNDGTDADVLTMPE